MRACDPRYMNFKETGCLVNVLLLSKLKELRNESTGHNNTQLSEETDNWLKKEENKGRWQIQPRGKYISKEEDYIYSAGCSNQKRAHRLMGPTICKNTKTEYE